MEGIVRKIAFLLALALVFLAADAHALTGIGVGVRAGVIADYDNPELAFENAKSIRIDDLSMFGGHIRFSRFPIFTLEIAAERSWRDEDFHVKGLKLNTEVEDFMIAANLKYIFKIPVLKPYLGGGIGWHQIVYKFGPAGVLDDVTIVIPEDGLRIGVHGLAGVAFSLPASPLEIFVEGRIGTISGENETTKYSAIYGGVTFLLL
jgi:hypothetical protein